MTFVLGLVPLILFGGALFYGMANVIAFRLVVGTILTLGFVPILYTRLFRVSTKDADSVARSSPVAAPTAAEQSPLTAGSSA